MAKANLASIHSDLIYKFVHVQFEPNSWSKESGNVSKKLTSVEDRRKFREGLKCNIDFSNQLNKHDLTKLFVGGE